MKKHIFFLLAVIAASVPTAQTKVGGVNFPATLTFEEEKLVLNGAGVREKFFMDMYAGALYLEQKNDNATAILNSHGAMAIRLHIISGFITSEKMIDAVNEGFKNSTNGNTAPINSEIKKFKSFFDEEINENDVFDIVYLPSKGVVVCRNGKEQGTINRDGFKKALFGIWLSSKPADKDLKEGMLGD